MFDASYVTDRFYDVWEIVFTALGLSPMNIFKYQTYSIEDLFNIPSVVIRKTTGTSTIDQKRRGNQYQKDLLPIWERTANFEIKITCRLKDTANLNLYTERLFSLFLREFEQGNVMNAGTDYQLDGSTPAAVNNKIQDVELGAITERYEYIEYSSLNYEQLIVNIPVTFYEFMQII